MNEHLTDEQLGKVLDENDRLRKFAQRTQERDWDRLDGALQCAANGIWSMECDWSVYCIIEAHAVTGTWTPDTVIPYGPLLLDGIYGAITGITVSEETLAGCRDYFAPFPERHVFSGSAAEARKSAEVARRELDEAVRGEE